MQRKSQPEQTSESISNTLTSFSITGSNLNFAKKSLIRDDNGSSKKIISCINDGFYELKKILDKDCIQYLKKNIPFDMDKEKITKTDPSTLLSYIREIAKYLIQVFENEENDENEENESPTNHYEELIQKLEADVRQHIRLEQQLKLYVEKNQEKVDEYEKIGNEKSHKLTKDLSQEQEMLKYELEKKEKELEKLQAEIKQKNNILALQEEDLRSHPKRKDFKEKIPLKEQDLSNNKFMKDRENEQNEYIKKDGKENINHKRSTSTLNGYGMIPNNDKNLNYLNIQKNEQSFSLTKPIENKTSLNNLNANSNKMRFAENDEHKTLFSTFTGSTNMTKELKNSPLKKTHYNISEINSKYVSKDKNAVNFPISDNRSQSVEPQAKLYHFPKDFSKGKDLKERNEEKSNDNRNKSSIGASFDLVKNSSSSNLNKNNRDSSRLRGQKIPIS